MDKFYLAPLQTYTDFIYRHAFHTKVCALEKYFIPFIRIEKNSIRNSYLDELKNLKIPNAIPQILCNNLEDLKRLTDLVLANNYTELNLNLGCPYPMVANKQLGSGLIKNTKSIDLLLDYLFTNYNLKISIKTRLGYNDRSEIEKLLPILNAYPLEEVIVHPRIGTDLYKGKIHYEQFLSIQERLQMNVVYNGDINIKADLLKLKNDLPATNTWMIGRGILKNTFLMHEINGMKKDVNTLRNFYNEIFYQISKHYQMENTVLQKLKEFWMYFSSNFKENTKIWKTIKKAKNLNEYNAIVSALVFY